MEGKKGERQKDLESPEHLGAEGAVSGAGRSGGREAREIGSQDELKRAFERPGGLTRIHKSDEKERRPNLKTDRQ
jgi:hypothetical protein